ncbi:patatin-like phospholipase family protein [Candidatus Chloroploca asiatica]|uniref:PNPLA domain-containing protein n=1 Tax=Candidatus Chloroploca asiatica TaxID=1506545 RepID=A0A2H3KQC0_9CHLR|nr:patatin-like phospholipase family protein [Candidatus Chloroploca asiatica]PDW00566.1 hypothetical protein A9Q02_09245 [Candidatus Chloroploca asiatica]
MSSQTSPRRVAIACQGGGSHTAFTAGVLKSLLRDEAHGRYQICALTGTSGGAICAALAWYGLIKVERGEWQREQISAIIQDFWLDNAPQLPWERFWNDWTMTLLNMQVRGKLPALKSSPYTPQMVLANDLLKQFAPRPEFLDLRMLLDKYFHVDEIQQPVDQPRLLLGAIAVMAGTFKAFDSMKAEISTDAVLASTTLPTLFQAIKIDDEVYWDGLFSQNPPVRQLVVGIDTALKPDEIWVVRINPQRITQEPMSIEEIEDRRNSLAGNLSLNHELDVIRKVSEWVRQGQLKDLGLKAVDIHSIEMSPHLKGSLNYVSKLNRDRDFLLNLIADGEAQADAFLANWNADVAAT